MPGIGLAGYRARHQCAHRQLRQSATSSRTTVGRVQNIVACLPGKTQGNKGVLVLAHYDSQLHAPGVGDDGAGVAAMLETIRALRSRPQLTTM
jgi:Zn-dependent M28 family amino/carboxypeptidase